MQPHLETHFEGVLESSADVDNAIGEVAELFACRVLGAVPLFAQYKRGVSEILWQNSRAMASVGAIGPSYPLELDAAWLHKRVEMNYPNQLHVVVAGSWTKVVHRKKSAVVDCVGRHAIVYVLTFTELLAWAMKCNNEIPFDDFVTRDPTLLVPAEWDGEKFEVLTSISVAAREVLKSKYD